MIRFISSAVLLVTVALAPGAEKADSPAALAAWGKKMQGKLAYGLYMGGKKAGYILEEISLGKHDGKAVLIVSSHQYWLTMYDGEKSVMDEKTSFHYELTGDGAMVYARVSRTEDGKSLSREAVRHGKGMRIVTKQNGRTLTRDVSLPKDNLASALALEAWLSGPRKAGDRFDKYTLAWNKTDIDQKESYTFKATKKLTIDKAEKTAYAVDIDIHGGKMVADLAPDGRPITGVLGGLVTLKQEPEAVAKKISAPADLMSSSCVVIDMDLGRSREVDELKLEMANLGDFQIPASHRQIAAKEKDKVILTLKRDFRVEKASPLTKADLKKYTDSTPHLQSDHKAVRAQAEKIVGDEKDVMKKARLIARWVYDTLKKSYQDNAETALEILDSKAGDCTEHSLLFVALARAVGVPAREVGGLAFVKDDKNDKPMMGWHAWAEIHDGHQWVSLDPTWHQVYVDGTHLKMSEGDEDLKWANVAGKLKIKVLSVTKRVK